MMPTRRQTLVGLAALAAAPAAAAPPRMAIGTYGGAGCSGKPVVKEFEDWLGRPLDVILDFLEMETWPGMVAMAGWMAGCWRGAGRRRLVISVPMLVKRDKPTIQQGARGLFDQHYRALGAKLVAEGFPDAILRIGWEFNGGWYPWTARGDPATFAAYWRRIARTLKATPGNRFRTDWCVTTVEGPTVAAWPGDDIVDIVGLDIYNQSYPKIADPLKRWQFLLNHQAGLIWHRDFARAHGKPRSFPEWGTGTKPDGHGGGDDPLFVRNMLDWMGRGEPVEYACYWNYPASDYNARIVDGRYPRAAAVLKRGWGRT